MSLFLLSQSLLTLGEHVEVQLWETWQVGSHNNQNKEEGIEGHVDSIWHFDTVWTIFSDIAQSKVSQSQFTGNTQRIQDNECSITQPNNCVWTNIIKLESIETVTDNFSYTPSNQKGCNEHGLEFSIFDLMFEVERKPDNEQTRENLHQGGENWRTDQSKQ